jgi:predicted DNA-binding WGR domain protein
VLRFKKNARFYHVYEQRNLFGFVTVIASWGSFNSKHGGNKKIFCNNQIEVDKAIENIKRTRKKRGYSPY